MFLSKDLKRSDGGHLAHEHTEKNLSGTDGSGKQQKYRSRKGMQLGS